MKQIKPAVELPDGYILNEKFSDDFEGTSLDPNKWAPLCPWFTGRTGAFYFDPGNVAVRNGLLSLTARVPEKGTAPLEFQLSGSDQFCTAFVQSRERLCYGYFEAKCRSMKANVCNAFWLHDPLDRPAKWRYGDFSEEIDIFEFFGKPNMKPTRKREYLMNIHRYYTPYVEGKCSSNHENTGSSVYVPYDFSEEFHVYSFLWTPEKLIWYIDGRQQYELPNTYHFRPMYLNFDCEVMVWEGLPDVNDLPSTFDTEYVRVWQKQE